MSLSAVSIALVLVANGSQVGRLTEREQAVWRRMEPGIATLLVGDRPVGAAALIDDSGLFVASKAAIQGETMSARLKSGLTVRMKVLARSGATGMVLLQADRWTPGQVRPFEAPQGTEKPNGTLLAVLGTGPIRAQFVSEKTFGVLGNSRRLVPLAELRFEAPAEAVGAALIVCEDGEIVGTLNATLRRPDSNSQGGLAQGITGGGLAPQLSRQLPGFNQQQQNAFGPGEMTVAYTVGRDVVRQVIEGFRSPSHQVAFPSLGVLCRDNIGGGALVEVVQPDSAAQRAGIRVGDIILDIAGIQIRNQVDFAKAMNSQRAGAKITIRTSRGNAVQVRDVLIGRVEDQDTL
jgi:hypothetical protein